MVKTETFAEYYVIKCCGFFNIEKQAWVIKNCPEGGYTIADMRDAGFGGWLKQLLPFATKMAKLNLSPEEHAVLCAICVITPGKVATLKGKFWVQ